MSALACASTGPFAPPDRGFLGSYSRLEAGRNGSRVFIDPRSDFAPYEEVLVDPVTIWVDDRTRERASDADLERLADRLEAALRRQLGQEFVLVERPGPKTLRLRAAIAQSMSAPDRLDLVSSSPARTPASTGDEALPPATRSFVANAAVEVEALDGLSNRQLAAGVDPQAAQRSLEREAANWADVDEAWNSWADGVQAALAAFRRTALGGDAIPVEEE